MSAPHVPVLMAEVIEALQPGPGQKIVDGTFGAGGYSRAILAAADCRVIAIDRDPDAIAAARAWEWEHLRSSRFADQLAASRVTLVRGGRLFCRLS